MGKPGPRHTNFEIIDRPDLSSTWRKAAEGGITVALWFLWVYMILPVFLTLALWIGGGRYVYGSLLQREHWQEMREVLQSGGIAILVIFLMHACWITYNFRVIAPRFAGRRKERPVSSADLAAKFFSVDPASIAAARLHNRLEIRLEGRKAVIKSAGTIASF
ncbi:MAG: poly-beta-1,6-N-acetyl-D-glucosamine biosynthesis protein PgaD [Candidatus Omnitrophota bacterium]